MKIRKTRQSERQVYCYTKEVSDGNGGYRTEKIVIKPGENDVTEVLIKKLHSMDDSEVYLNMKHFQGIRTNREKAEVKEWIAQYIEQFKIEHDGIEPEKRVVQEAVKKQFPMIEVRSLNAFYGEDSAEDKNNLHYKAYLEDESKKETDPLLERLDVVITQLNDDQKWLIQKVYYENVPQTEIAIELGISKQAVQSRLNKIYTKMKKLF